MGEGLRNAEGFHSISFPSEWGVEQRAMEQSVNAYVSIQLVSPASGELTQAQ